MSKEMTFSIWSLEKSYASFRIIDIHGTYGKILYDRIYIFGTNRTLKEAVDQLGIKGDRNIEQSS